MIFMKKNVIAAALAIGTLTLASAPAMATAGIGITTNVTLVSGLSIGSMQPLAAGMVSKPSNAGTTDYLTVGITGSCSASISRGSAISTLSSPQLGQAVVSGLPNASVAITVNSNASSVTLTGPSSTSMTVDNLVYCWGSSSSTPAAATSTGAALGSDGNLTIKVGGRFAISGSAPDGSYSGFVMVVVAYE
jgi:hypothetical protein